uniref:Uncharacterized protein n=1 Tax=Chromera velia CCMP2878 TaxID=1169474 RepID=A0A0G4HUX0_9ALVE|eukprot:Cvel_8711.t1-p1 / transcript=Cvel_8711.t1 / gene=Cvel_8711 / organism=Chromera_velia_CCMP2878 / gene_product=Uncharacterized protein At2g23090, putative / transcript_product=Uncharacterized protein At2g23090, putative / location=Cvel_scaffold486:49332-52867(+) / protein_length=77 / sequence_SO=supercontig / SO=protein_coding / is_pseudo=false
MGRSNACKAQQKRDRNAAAANAGGKSQLKVNQQAMTTFCSVCRQPFMSTQNKMQLQQHVDGKHPKNSFDECFPGYQS